MAGYVHITNEIGLSMSTISFNAITELSRVNFKVELKRYELEIYSPVDEGEMDFISLIEQEQEGFMAFYEALAQTYDNCKQVGRCGALDGQFYGMVMGTWEELLSLMEQDKRFVR